MLRMKNEAGRGRKRLLNAVRAFDGSEGEGVGTETPFYFATVTLHMAIRPFRLQEQLA